MRILFVGLMLTLAAMAGCLGGDDDPDPTPTPTPTSTSTPTASPSPTPTGEPEPDPENTPPTASLSASIEQGEIPVNVTFTLDGADTDGDALSWTLDLGDGNTSDGTELPATVEHSYTMEGLYTVVFTVSDGTDTGAQTLTINATAAAAGEVGATSQEFSGSWQLDNPECLSPTGDGSMVFAAEPLPVTTFAAADVVEGTWGKPYRADYTPAADAFFSIIAFFDADGGLIESLSDLEDGPDFFIIEGNVPTGATVVAFYSCAGGPNEVVYSAG